MRRRNHSDDTGETGEQMYRIIPYHLVERKSVKTGKIGCVKRVRVRTHFCVFYTKKECILEPIPKIFFIIYVY